ncbi:hypothetical protein [Amycolatopsis sp. NPDC051371]|uniref:hypothetical protein n=1 Tax=Amycolatopsis sp. NPDC051371 TaxID=3155800 RepID=UPI00342FDC7F
MKTIAFIVACISAWLTFGAVSLHQKDPVHHNLTLALVLGAVTVLSLLFVFSGSKAKAKSSR